MTDEEKRIRVSELRDILNFCEGNYVFLDTTETGYLELTVMEKELKKRIKELEKE
jgi:hypothetical protein